MDKCYKPGLSSPLDSCFTNTLLGMENLPWPLVALSFSRCVRQFTSLLLTLKFFRDSHYQIPLM